MTQQDIIKAFVDKLANHGQAYSASIGTNMLDSAVRASSRYSGIEDVIAAMKADQINAEKEAVEEVLGSEYAGKTLAEVSSDILSASAKDYDGAKSSNSYYNDANDYRSTVENVIKERKAYIFLEKYCDIQLTTKYFFNENSITFWNNWTYDNTDTGAITGSDAGGSTPKTDRTIVPEEFNTYTAATSDAQNITTDNRAWVINATSYGDTITSNGADYINAGAGDDQITVNADGATVIGGAGEDVITISQNVRDVTIKDFNEEDTLTISGEFEIGSAQIEDTLLVITDKTGTRKIRLSDFETAKNAQINGTTLAELLHSAGIDFNNFATSNYSAGKVIGTSSGNVGNELPDELNDDSGRIAIDPDYKPSSAPEVVKKRLMMSGPIGSANTSSGGTVTVDLSTVDASISNDETSKEITGGTLSNSYPNASTFTRNGLTIHLLGVSSSTSGRPTDESTYESLITAKTFDELTDDQKTIIAGLFKWWGKECLKLNEESHNLGFTSDTAAVKEIGLYFFDGDKNCNTLATVWNWGTSSSTNDGAATQLMLNVNMKYYNNLSENDINGSSSISGAGFLDRTLAHEFNHAILASNVNYFSFLPQFAKEGIAELTHGIDDERGNRIFEIAYIDSRLDAALDTSNSGTGTNDAYAGGFMFWRYLAKQAAAQTESLPAFGEITATVNLNGNGIYYINGDSTSETAKVAASLPSGAIKLGEVSDGVYTVENTGVHQVISATSAVKVVGLTVNDTFNGTSGADTVETSEGSNIITGAGNDSIDLRGQFATISTGADDDTVNVADGSHHLINLGDGNNLVSVAVFSYNDTILSGAGNDNISGLINGIGNVVSTGGGADLLGTYNYTSNTKNLFDAGEGDDNITVGAGYNNTFLGGAGSDVIRLLNFIINGNEYTTAITNNYIDAGADDDTVLAYGSNNTIVGGAGNDVIYSYGTGGNIFRFNKPFGEDVIVGLKANDTILLAAGYQMAVVASGTENDKNYAILQVSDKNDSLAGYLSLSDYAVSDTTFQYESAGQVIQNADASMVTGTNLDDNIINVADSATVDSRAGNDTILSMASNTSINAGAGNDQVSLMADAGYVLDSNVVELGDGADLAEVHTNSNIIKGGAGVDYVGIYGGNNNLVELGADNNLADIITDDNDSNGTGNTIVGGDAIDRIGVYASGNSVESGAGDDVIEVTSDNNTVNAGDDDDFVAFRAQKYDDIGNPVYDKDGYLDYNYYFVENNKIDLGAGNDLILLFGMSNTITGGTGNDDILNLGEESIETSANVYTFTEDNFGSDTIENFFATDKLVFADGMIYETQAAQVNYGTEDKPASGTRIIVTVTKDGNAAGTITLENVMGDFDAATNIEGGHEFENEVLTSLTLTDSDASAMTLAADIKTVNASARTKAIKIVGNELDNSIAGGSGNDTLNGSTGDDTLTGNAGNDLFIYSDGNDVITDYTAGDKISVTGEYSYELSGGDLILNFDDGKLTIKDAANTPITLNGASKKFTAEGVMTGAGTAITLNADVTNYSATDSVLVTVDGSAVTGALKVVGNDKSNVIKAGSGGSTLNGGKGNDNLYGNNGADTFVYEHTETISTTYITVEGGGVSAVVSTIYSSGSDVIHNYGTNDKISLASDVELKDAYKQNDDVIFKVDSGAITVKDSADKAITFAQGDEEITFSGDVFSKPDTSILPATFDTEVTLGAATKNLDASKRGATKLVGNELNNSIVGGKGADTLDGSTGDDTLTGGAGSDVFVFSGGDDTITDYGNGSDKISAASDYQSYSISSNDIIFNFADGSLTVKDGVGKAINFNGVAKVLAADKIFNSNSTAVTLGATTTSFDATKFETLVTIDGSAVTSGLEVVGNAKANKIYAGTGGSTLDGGAGNDTLTGGAGSDKFVYGVGNDVIENYGAGDKISLASDVTITDFYKTNDDLYIKFSAGSLTVKNTSAVTFTQDGKEFSYSDGKLVSGDSVILPATFANEFTLDANTTNVDASKLTAATKLTGNTLDNSITGGKGADTLDASTGDDTLTGGAGSDVFVFSGGDDTITDYGNGSDKISAASDYQSYSINGEDITFTFANGSLKLIGAAEKSININGVAKKFSADKTFNSNNTAVTLGANATTYTADEIVVTIDGSAVTSGLKVVGNDKSNRIYAGNNGSTLNGGLGSDYLYGGDGADTFVYEHVQQEKTTYTAAGAVVSTIYTSGSDVIYNYAEDDKISLGSDVVLKDTYKQNNDVIVKVDNGTITLKDSADKSITFAQGDEEITFSGGVFVNGETVLLPATFDSKFTLDAEKTNLDASMRSSAIKLVGNEKDNSILGGKSSDTIDGGLGDDTLTGGAGNDTFVYSGGEDIITDYGTGSDKISIASGFTRENSVVNGNDIVWDFGEGNSLTIKDYTGKITTISASAAASVGTEDKFNSKKTSVTLGTATTTFDATEYPNLVTINAAATDGVSITGNAKSNQVYFGEGNDLFAYSSNETTKTTYTSIEGGGVSAIVSTIYSSGSDVIYNYAEGDKISLGADVVLKNAYKKNSDTIINVDSGTITLKDSDDKAVTFVQGGEEIIFSGGVFSKPDTSILPATFDTEVTLGATTTNLDASKRTAATKLTGNSDDNEIIGGTKNDTLDGGAGNDTLTGNAGADTFIYSGGDDVITDYGVGSDKIIAPEVNGYSIDDDNITFTFDAGTLKLEGAADSLITINGVAGKYSNDGVLNSKGTAITLPASATTYTADETVVTIDGSQTTNAILIGNAKSNRFYGGTGSTFVYKGGSDIVYNYANGDKISLGAESVLKDFYTKNSDVIVKVDSGTITFKNSSDKTITLTQDGETFTYSNGELTGGETLILPATFNSEYTLSGKANVDASKRTKAIKLTGTNAANSITGGTKNDTLDGGAGDDTLTGGEGSDTFIYSGGNDVIKDYGVGSDKIIAPEVNGYSINGGNITFTFDNGTLKLEGAADSLITINGVAGKYSNDGVLNSKETSITLNASATTYTAGDAIVTINGSRTNGVTVKGNIKNNQFYAGSGADVFVYEHNEYTVEKVTADGVIEKTLHGSGSDVIHNYGAGDKISLGSDVVLKNGYMKNADFVARVDDGYITVKSSSEVTFTQDSKEFEFNGKVFASGDSVSIPATFDGEYTLGANAKNLNASMRTSAIKLTGNASDNSIVGGTKNDTIYGGAGADMLWGGKGNDTLYGGDGDDTFIFQFGDGKDTILDFASGDMLKILDADGKSISYSKASYSSGTLTLTVADSGGTIYLKNLTTATNININGTNHAISGKTLD